MWLVVYNGNKWHLLFVAVAIYHYFGRLAFFFFFDLLHLWDRLQIGASLHSSKYGS